jgi:hypothetical protein
VRLDAPVDARRARRQRVHPPPVSGPVVEARSAPGRGAARTGARPTCDPPRRQARCRDGCRRGCGRGRDGFLVWSTRLPARARGGRAPWRGVCGTRASR